MQVLQQIKTPERQYHGVKLRIKDLYNASVQSIYNELLYILKKENPQIVQDMIFEGAMRLEHDEKVMTEELTKD